MIKKDFTGVSPIISTMLILVLMLTMITIVLLWGTPTIHYIETSAQYRASIGDFRTLDTIIENVIHGGINATANTNLRIHSGKLYFNRDETWVVSYTDCEYTGTVLFDGFGDDDKYKFTIMHTTAPIKVFVWKVSGNTKTLICVSSELTAEGTSEITTAQPLEGTAYIEIREPTYEPDDMVAAAWMFDINSFTYKMITMAGTYHIRSVNGGITSDYPSSRHVVDPPLYLDDNSRTLFLYMIQYVPTGITSGGPGNYNIDIKLSAQYIREPKEEYVKNVRIQIFSKYDTAWYDELVRAQMYHVGSPRTYVGFVRDTKYNIPLYQVPNEVNPVENNLVELTLIQCQLEFSLETT
jgi:hypothetical protein